MALCGAGRDDALVLFGGTGGYAEEGREVLCPSAKLGCGDAGRVVLVVVEDAKDVVGEVFCNGDGHAGETVHEEIGGLL